MRAMLENVDMRGNIEALPALMPVAITLRFSHANDELGSQGPVKQDDGRGDRIRTCDPLVPNQMRYQAAPLPESGGH